MAAEPIKISLKISNLRKEFDRRPVFKNLDFTLTNNDSIAITGRNGSGKSTLIKVLANVYTQTSGNIELSLDGKQIERQHYYKYLGFVSPYLNLYDEFTGYENLHFVTKVRGLKPDGIDESLTRVGLYDRRHDLVKIYSSIMKNNDARDTIIQQLVTGVFCVLIGQQFSVWQNQKGNDLPTPEIQVNVVAILTQSWWQ